MGRDLTSPTMGVRQLPPFSVLFFTYLVYFLLFKTYLTSDWSIFNPRLLIGRFKKRGVASREKPRKPAIKGQAGERSSFFIGSRRERIVWKMAEENPDGRLHDILRWIQAEAGHEEIQTLLQQCQLASSSATAVTSLPTAEPPGSPSEEAASSSGADVAIQRTPASRGPGKKRIVAVKRNTRGKQAAKKRTQVTSAVSAKKRIVADPPQTGVWPSASPPSSRVSSAAVASGGPLQQKSCNALGPFPSTGSGGGPAAGSSHVGHQVGRGPQSRPEPGPSSCNTIGHPVRPPASMGHALPSSAIHSAPQPAGLNPQEESQPIQVIGF
ncbi:uncharacterized protein LOC121403117 isoform X3 [Xenopus laevis]|uniref:Uncharacterized protein LOC121403117 isoform X3 n=1 Tax=Xenopus laevis TaxID=8355 RepID=A0A8J1MY93_XENLA|nr:uncharacterized protein LOC121403117 isoform X3 [Xenopus laevis]